MTPADGDGDLRLAPADESALDGIEELLAANDLPHDGLAASPGEFVAGYVGGDLAAGGGVELYGSDALLRSVVVAEPHRSRGHGAELSRRLLAVAADEGATDCYLLTTTASGFFRAHGFEDVQRADLPKAVRQSTLVSTHCPTSATCMHRPVVE